MIFTRYQKKHSFLCKKIIEEFVTRTNSTMFIVCNRPNEFYSTELENAVKRRGLGNGIYLVFLLMMYIQVLK